MYNEKSAAFLPIKKAVKIWSIITMVICAIGIPSCVYMALLYNSYILLLYAIPFISLPTLNICRFPRKLTVKEYEIDIQLVAKNITILSHEVEAIEHYPKGITIIPGSNKTSLFGNLGKFDCKECGKHLSFVTNPKDVCVIKRKNAEPIAVSIEDYSILNSICEVTEIEQE